MKNSSRHIWEQPWGYREGILIAAGIGLSGLILQLFLGNIHPTLFAAPLNLIIGALFMTGLLAVYLLARKRPLGRWLTSVAATLPALALFLLLSIFLGVIPQFPSGSETALPDNLFTSLGWYRMTTSWPFVLICFYLLLILGLTTLRRTTRKQEWRDIGFYLNHLGLFIALLGGVLGSADMERLTMRVQEGQVEWRGTTATGALKELPLAIQLDSFLLEEYPPKLVVIEHESGRMLPTERPESYMFEGVGKTTDLAGYTVEILEFLPHAAIFSNDSITRVVPMLMEGATAALRVRVTPEGGAAPKEGWVSNGSYLYPHSLLRIDETRSLAMPLQEVKRYTSHVTLYTEEGHTRKSLIEVNHPVMMEEWMIYQYSYDDTKGKYSDTSVFELVRDPWLKVVYTGIFMLLAGALFLFFAGPKKSRS